MSSKLSITNRLLISIYHVKGLNFSVVNSVQVKNGECSIYSINEYDYTVLMVQMQIHERVWAKASTILLHM